MMLIAVLLGCPTADKAPDDTAPTNVADCSGFGLEVPSPRGEVAGVWDPLNRRFLVFGGDDGVPVECSSQTTFVDELWAFYPDCDAWELVAATGPGPRGRHVAAYDAARERMIVYGGRYRDGTSGNYTNLDDTWAFDFATDTWTELATEGPGGRAMSVGVVGGDQFVIYGGNLSEDGGSYDSQKDAWSLDLSTNTWTELSPGSGPGKRIFHAATVSSDGGTMYVYGGGDDGAFTGPFFGDLWAMDLNDPSWTELDDGSGNRVPDFRIWPNLLTKPDGNLLLWAGHDDQELGNRNDLWTYDLGGGGWEQHVEGDVYNAPANGFCDFPADFVIPDLDVPERRDAGAAAMTDDGALLVFGGKTDCGIINDVWSWSVSDSTWSERSQATFGEICLRAYAECSTMCF